MDNTSPLGPGPRGPSWGIAAAWILLSLGVFLKLVIFNSETFARLIKSP